MLTQTTAITGVNLKSLPERWGPSLVIIVGLAGVVAVFTALLAMREGFESTLKATGRKDVALILRGASSSELNSGLSRDEATLIKQGPGIRRDAEDKPVASGEIMVITELFRRGETQNGSCVYPRDCLPRYTCAVSGPGIGRCFPACAVSGGTCPPGLACQPVATGAAWSYCF